MSKLGMSLIARLREEGSLEAVTAAGVRAEMLKGTSQRVFKAVTRHFRKFQKMPEWETLLEELGIDPDLIPKTAPEPAAYYAERVVARAAIEMQRDAMKKIAKALTSQDPEAVASEAKLLLRVSAEKYGIGAGRISNMKNTFDERLTRYHALKEYEGGIVGVPYAWDPLSQATQGLKPGDLVSLVARLGVGKTWWGCIQAERARAHGTSVGFISMEMTREALEQRLDAIRFRLPYEHLRRGQLDSENEARYIEALRSREGVSDEPDFLIVTEGIETVEDIDLFVEETNVGLLIVDGVYLLADPKARNDYERVTRSIRTLKKIAKKKGRNIPVVALTQFRKTVKTGATKGGTEDIAFSDAIGQDSDVVIALFQDADMRASKQMQQTTLKNREGKPIEFTCSWDFDAMEFDVVGEASEPGGQEAKTRGGNGDEDIPF